MLETFIIANRTEPNDAQTILGRSLASSRCDIDVKRGQITFEVEGCYAMFCFMNERVVSPNSSQSDAFALFPEIDMEDGLDCQDPSDFDWMSTEDPNQGYMKVKFAASTPPSIPKVEAQLLMSLL